MSLKLHSFLVSGSGLSNTPTNGRVAERPQIIMRIAVAIHGYDIDRVIEMYNLMSVIRYFTPLFFQSFQCRCIENYERWLNRGIVRLLARPLVGLALAFTAFVLRGSCSSFFPFLSMFRKTFRSYVAGTNVTPMESCRYCEPTTPLLDPCKNHG